LFVFLFSRPAGGGYPKFAAHFRSFGFTESVPRI
jgi:hypothetical protein